MNAEQAARGFQVAKASLQRQGLRVSAAFVPREALADADFRKGYLFARNWKRGSRLVSQGSAHFEAGLYAGISDMPAVQQVWVAEHRRLAPRHAALSARLAAHESFTRQYAGQHENALVRGLYVQAGTSVDLVTDGPGTSPDPAGSTPLNGPGTEPPMAGRSDPAKSGGPSPYQGAQPAGPGPVVPDDVMGQPQEPPQPDGPRPGFSGDAPGDRIVAPDPAVQPGYSNPAADQGNPHHKAAIFRNRVQSNLRLLQQTARAS